MTIISLINQKGGVGKTTTALNLGAGLAQKNKKVLLVDLDSQGNLTQSLQYEKPKGNIYTLLSKVDVVQNCIAEVSNNLHIIPSIKELAYLQVELMQDVGGNLRLKKSLESVKNKYDYILIDNSPALSSFAYNSLVASDRAIICIQSDSLYSLTGLDLMKDIISEVEEHLNKNLKIFNILLNFYDKRKILIRDITESLEKTYEEIVFNSKIRQCLAISESQAQGTDIFSYSKNSNGAKDYSDLANEIINNKQVA